MRGVGRTGGAQDVPRGGTGEGVRDAGGVVKGIDVFDLDASGLSVGITVSLSNCRRGGQGRHRHGE